MLGRMLGPPIPLNDSVSSPQPIGRSILVQILDATKGDKRHEFAILHQDLTQASFEQLETEFANATFKPFKHMNWGYKKTPFDLDAEVGSNGGDGVFIVWKIIEPDAHFMANRKHAIAAGDPAAVQKLYNPLVYPGGTHRPRMASVKCQTGTQGTPSYVDFVLGVVELKRREDGLHELPVWFDPAIKNDG